jgi:hypothetical protein
MVTAIVSVMTGIPVRRDLAMTGVQGPAIRAFNNHTPVTDVEAAGTGRGRGGSPTNPRQVICVSYLLSRCVERHPLFGHHCDFQRFCGIKIILSSVV